METTIDIKNFRVFDKNGASFELTPITILTGSNSSGKSSVAKAVFLLNSFLAQIKKDIEYGHAIELDKYKLDFTKYPNNLLGRFDKVVNRKSDDNTISIGFSMYSLILSKDVQVELVFSADENDELNNAYLDSITMSTDDGIFYSSSNSEPSYCNLNILKDECASFSLAERAIHKYCIVEGAYDVEGAMTEDEYNSNVDSIRECLRSVDKSRRDDILRYVRFANSPKTVIETEEQSHSMEQMNEDGVVFSIPLLDKLDEFNKTEVESFINSHFMNGASDGIKAATSKVMKAYMQSEFDKFSAFFHNFEEKYLQHAVLGTAGKGVRMLTPGQLSLEGFFYDPSFFDIVFLNRDGSSDFDEPTEEEKAAEKRKEIQKWENRDLTFEFLYGIVMKWNHRYEETMDNQSKRPYVYEEPSMSNPAGSIYHITYQLLTKFAAAVVNEAITPEWAGNMSYISSSRASVHRLYTLEGNDDFSQLLQNYFEKKRLFVKNQKEASYCSANREYTPDSFMNRWVDRFGIGKSITLDPDEEGLGVKIRLHKTSKDKKGRLLADEGYGITQLASILLQIETAILSAQGEKVNNYYGLHALDGYEFFKFHYEVNTIFIEEPEIHLHPKYQSILADMFLEACQKFNIHFVVETHSEYLIRKLQLLVSGHVEGVDFDSSMLSIYYINSEDDKAKQKVKRIGICSDGYLDDSFGEGFYDEASRLSRQLM